MATPRGTRFEIERDDVLPDGAASAPGCHSGRSSLKEWGVSRGAGDLFRSFLACFWVRRVEVSGSRLAAKPRPRSGRRALTSAPGGAGCSGQEGRGCSGLLVLWS